MKADRIVPTSTTRATYEVPGTRLILSERGIAEFREGLSIGEILRGQVLTVVNEDTSVIRFRGFNLVTQSETPLQQGAQVHAEVTGIGEQITMRLLIPGGGLDRAATLLEEQGLPVDRATLRLVALMTRAGIPITGDNLSHLFARLEALPSGQRVADLLVLSQLLDVPDSAATLDALRVLTEPQVPMGDRIGQLAAQLASTLEVVPPEAGRTLHALGAVASTLPLRPGESFTPQQLRWFLHYVGVDYEASLTRNAAPDAAFKGLLLGARTELAALILAARQAGGNAAGLEALRGNIDGLLRQLDAFQLLSRIPGLNLPHLYLHIPYWLAAAAGNPLTLIVRGRKENPTGEMDADSNEIEFSVRTKRWGVLRLRFTIREARIRGTIDAETPAAREAVERHLPEFTKRLLDFGYSVTQITCRVVEAVDLEKPVVPRLDWGDTIVNIEV